MDSSDRYSERIKTIASYVSKGVFFADIGTDHAYLPCYICKFDKQARAIAGELNEGPYKTALENVHLYKLNNQITVRKNFGLNVIQDDAVKEVIIAGMGGSLITQILEDGHKYLNTVNRIIIQPNISANNVRKWCVKNNYLITDETLVKDNNHIYEIIVASKQLSVSETLNLSRKECLLGPILLKEKTPLFYEKWTSQLKKTEYIKKQIKRSKIKNDAKILKLNEEIDWIKEAIEYDDD